MKAIGCHVFAGGFSMGVREVIEVPAQLEIHGLGRETVRSLGIDFIEENSWEGWPKFEGDFLFGNPRCTGFSCMTGGYGDHAHGPWSKPTRDIHDFMNYGIENEFPVMCWESVQQAYSTGKPLLDWLLKERLIPNNYKVAHLFINAATFGNAQHRKRYFFVAYKDHLRFNIEAPPFLKKHTTVGDVLGVPDLLEREVVGGHFARKYGYTADTYAEQFGPMQNVLEMLEPGEDVNALCRRDCDAVERVNPKIAEVWYTRMSEMPFSMHALCRLEWNRAAPVIAGDAARLVHPTLHRCITVREAARLMGWPKDVIPIGENPFGQIGKGIVPAIGTWLAEQVEHCLNNVWDDDFSTTWNDITGRWEGEIRATPPDEKILDLTRWAPLRPKKPKQGIAS